MPFPDFTPPTPTNPTTPAAPTPAPSAGAQTTPQPTEPAPTPAPSATAPTPAPQQQQTAPLSVYDMIVASSAQPAPEQTPEIAAQQNAAQLISTLMQGAPDPRHDSSTVPGINMQALATMLPTMGLDQGIDFNAIVEGMNGDDPAAAFKAAMIQSQQNTITAIAPLINQMATALASTMAQQQTQTNHVDMTSAAIVKTFNERYAYGTNPAVSPMLTNMANAVAQSAPRNADASKIADQIHAMLQTMGTSMVQPPAHAAPNPNQTTNMSGLFDN